MNRQYAVFVAAGLAESVLGLDEVGLGHDHSHDGDGHDHSGDDHTRDDGHGHGDEHSHDDDHSHTDDDHGRDHGDGGGVVEVTIDHLRGDAIALSTKLAEFAAAAIFTGLAIAER